VGIVEIGSRAIRLLVAEIAANGRLTTVTSDWRETGLASAQSAGGEVLDQKVDVVADVVNAFQRESQVRQVQRMCIFATEAVRRMSKEHTDILRQRIPGLEVIDRKTEACCSLLGALTPFEAPLPMGESFIIDQGAGSMELAVGHISARGVELSAYNSYRLGTQELVEDLNACRKDFQRFITGLQNKVRNLKLLAVDPKLSPIILGSAATKMAWIRIRRNPSDRYDPARVHGQVIETQSIDKLADLALRAPEKVRPIIDPSKPDSPEFETVMTGLIALSLFLKRLGKAEFKVSAYGPRYGVVWMTVLYRKLGFDVPAGAQLGLHEECGESVTLATGTGASSRSKPAAATRPAHPANPPDG
jgi:exopolyphosphatase/guanosine-5'-triphosphate,3'-diphosphate pyrophosphatase